MGFIYKITNKINNKVYIGKTKYNNPQKRFKEHINDSKKDRCKHRPLYRAFNKYGIENFIFEILENIVNNKLEDREIYYIEKYNSFGDDGYNATKGGDGKSYLKISEHQIIAFFLSKGNRIVSRTAKEFSIDPATVKNILDNNNIKHYTISEYNKLQQLNGRKIKQYDKNTMECLNVFHSIGDANAFLGKKRTSSNIGNCLSVKNKTAFGFVWKYA